MADTSAEPEGLGEDEGGSWGDYPIDTVLIRNENRTVHDVLRRIEQETFVMNPEFQRDFVWSEEKQSKLIESVLMRIPLPVFYLAEHFQSRRTPALRSGHRSKKLAVFEVHFPESPNQSSLAVVPRYCGKQI